LLRRVDAEGHQVPVARLHEITMKAFHETGRRPCTFKRVAIEYLAQLRKAGRIHALCVEERSVRRQPECGRHAGIRVDNAMAPGVVDDDLVVDPKEISPNRRVGRYPYELRIVEERAREEFARRVQ
jgi:hypothetical protein